MRFGGRLCLVQKSILPKRGWLGGGYRNGPKDCGERAGGKRKKWNVLRKRCVYQLIRHHIVPKNRDNAEDKVNC